MKGSVLAGGFILAVILAMQLRRVLHLERDVYTHHNESCNVVPTGFYVADLTRYADFLLALDLDASIFSEGAKTADRGRLMFLDKENAVYEVNVQNFPADVSFNPLGFYLLKPDSLYVLNYAYGVEAMRVEMFNLTATPDSVSAVHLGSVYFNPEIQLTASDLIVTSQEELYLAQHSSLPLPETPSLFSRLKTWAYDFLQIEAAYVQHCTFKLGERATCRPLENTKAVSVSGITMDKFGHFMVAYSSIDSNSVKYYERNWRQGDFDFTNDVPVRDAIAKIEWEHGKQRVYSASVPLPLTDPSYVGAIEYRMWEMKSGKVGRRLFMAHGLFIGEDRAYPFKGGEIATWFFGHVYVGSLQSKGLLKCEGS